MGGLQSLGLLVGRILLSVMFVTAGYGKIAKFAGTAAAIASKGLPLPDVAAALTILVELGGGILLILGLKTRWAAVALAVFTAAATYFFHAFWKASAAEMHLQQLMFQKNLAVVGGMLLLAAAGPGRFSLDRR